MVLCYRIVTLLIKNLACIIKANAGIAAGIPFKTQNKYS